MSRFFATLIGILIFAALAVAGWLLLFANMRLDLPTTPFEFKVKPGATLKSVSRQLADANLLPESTSFWILGRILNKATGIQAGAYKLDKATTSPRLSLSSNARGVVAFSSL